MGLPLGAAKNAMTKDKLDPSVMDGDHDLPAPDNNKATSGGVPLKHDPKYEKYFKMLKMGLPLGAAKNAMLKDKLDPSVMDGDHDLPAPDNYKPAAPSRSKKPAIQDRCERARWRWITTDVGESDISESAWGGDSSDVDNIIYGEEIKQFVQREKAENTKSARNPVSRNVASKIQKGGEKVIQSKRAHECDILLQNIARSMTHEDIIAAVDEFDVNVLSLEQLTIVEQILPSEKETKDLVQFMARGKLADLREPEQFMVKTMSVNQCREKVEAFRFLLDYPHLLAELKKNLKIITNACNELKSSQRFKIILKAVLKFGNEINTSGPTGTGKASAITLSSLITLGEAKSIDKNIPLLQIFVRQILKRQEDLASFEDDIPSVSEAVRVEWKFKVEEAYKEIYKRVVPLSKLEHLKPVQTFCVKEGLHAQGSFMSDLKDSIDFAKCQFDQLTKDYFLEKGEQIPHQWFANINEFTKSFNKAKEEVVRQLAAAEKKAGRMKAKGGRIAIAITGNANAPASRNGGRNELKTPLEKKRHGALSTPTTSSIPAKGINELSALLVKRRNRILNSSTATITTIPDEGRERGLKILML